MVVLCNFLRKKLGGFRQKDSQGLVLELIQLYKQNPLEKFLIFTIYKTIHWL